MSDPDNPLNAPVPVPPSEDDEAEPLGTFSAFKLTAIKEHVDAKHPGEFEACGEPGCSQARDMLQGLA